MDICKGHPGIGDEVSGRALVASDNFSARYDLDRIKGVFSRPQHKLYSQSYDGKILVLNVAKGGVATAWMLKEMVSRGVAPKAIILNFANPIMAQGAAFANMSLIDRFDTDITEFVPDGAEVKVTPETGEIWIL
jgi:predicted aconitase with swiveling domain